MEDIYIQYRHKKYFINPPDYWKILTFAVFEENFKKQDVEALTRNVLKNPIRSEPLSSRVNPSDRVAVIIEDLTRASPKAIVLEALLDELREAGIPDKSISIVISLGSHRRPNHEEIAQGYGRDIVKRYEFISHDCLSPDLVPIGRLKTGAEVKINRIVYEADFRIGVGSIFPHPMNGFGGGGKILFPGVADRESMLEHHLKYSLRKEAGLGRLDGNPFYEEVCSLSKAGGLDFIINSVLDHNDRLYDLVCGDPIEAHLAGVEIERGIISRRFRGMSDLTLITAFPYSEGQQVMKPLAPASIITKEGGCIILFADMITPLPEILLKACEAFRQRHGSNLTSALFDHFERNLGIKDGLPPELNMALAQALMAQDRFRVILVSEDIPRETVERIGFYYAEDPDRAFEMSREFCPDPEVNIIPSGGIILPIIE